jgi:diguanylate cyclase (GGDEF)-like protein
MKTGARDDKARRERHRSRRTQQGTDRDLESPLQAGATEIGESRADFRAVVEKVHAGVLILDGKGRITFSNSTAAQLLQRSRGELIGSDFGIPSTNGVTEMEVLSNGQQQGIAEVRATETQWNGQAAFLVTLIDISMHKRAEAKIQHVAYYDALTGLPNRLLFIEHLNHALARARRDGAYIAVLFLDLDGFKAINDTYGHQVGDKLLAEVAERLGKMRKSDLVARMGGDEFTIMLEGLRTGSDASRPVESLLKAFAEPFRVANRSHYIDASIGIAIYPENGEDASTLLKNADIAMYRAKRGEEGPYLHYRAEMGHSMAGKLTLEQELRRALDREEIELWYQPQVDLSSGQVVGLEALLRWRHPVRSLVTAEHFVPTLEETGLIVPVGAWALDKACVQIRALDGAGWDIPVAVNVSGLQLRRGDFAKSMRMLLKRHGLGEGRLNLELTESGVMKNLGRSITALRELKALGISLIMDNFSVGYSSLSTLKRLPFDMVKIDGSFVHGLLAENDGVTLISVIIAMVHKLGKSVLADGVENKEQADLLLAEGCDLAQGWFFGRPVPAAELRLLGLEQDRFAKTGRPAP